MQFKLILTLISILSFVSLAASARANDADLKFTSKKPGAETTIVFIHGFGSSSDKSWRHPSATYSVPELVENDSNLINLNIATVDYSSFFRDGPGIEDIAWDIAREIKDEVHPDQRLIFVAHSLGGILSREVLLYDSTIKDRTLGIVTFATPMGGSKIADFARSLNFGGPVVRQLQQINDGNANYMTSLLRRWARLQNKSLVPVHCAAEEEPWPRSGVVIVNHVSAWLGCTHSLENFPDHHHNNINKPKHSNDRPYYWLQRVILEILE